MKVCYAYYLFNFYLTLCTNCGRYSENLNKILAGGFYQTVQQKQSNWRNLA